MIDYLTDICRQAAEESDQPQDEFPADGDFSTFKPHDWIIDAMLKLLSDKVGELETLKGECLLEISKLEKNNRTVLAAEVRGLRQAIDVLTATKQKGQNLE